MKNYEKNEKVEKIRNHNVSKKLTKKEEKEAERNEVKKKKEEESTNSGYEHTQNVH